MERDSSLDNPPLAGRATLVDEMMHVATITGEVLGTPSPELQAKLDAAGVPVYAPYEPGT